MSVAKQMDRWAGQAFLAAAVVGPLAAVSDTWLRKDITQLLMYLEALIFGAFLAFSYAREWAERENR